MSDCRFGVSPVNYPDPDPDIKLALGVCFVYISLLLVGLRFILLLKFSNVFFSKNSIFH